MKQFSENSYKNKFLNIFFPEVSPIRGKKFPGILLDIPSGINAFCDLYKNLPGDFFKKFLPNISRDSLRFFFQKLLPIFKIFRKVFHFFFFRYFLKKSLGNLSAIASTVFPMISLGIF